VNANRAQSLERPSTSGARVTSDHISELLSTFRELREQGRSVMARLRESMYEMQAHRARLRRERDGQSPDGSAAAPVPAISTLQQQFGMTPREVEVALLLAEGCSNSTLAQRLGISPHTARHHTQRVLVKLGVRSRAEAGARLRR
jgi:Response regulator containing a CheY-like receiver domain and an HTH DNA-binding domain